MTRLAAPIVLAALLLLAGAIVRAEPPDVAAERQRIAAARAAADQRYAERERECSQSIQRMRLCRAARCLASPAQKKLWAGRKQ